MASTDVPALDTNGLTAILNSIDTAIHTSTSGSRLFSISAPSNQTGTGSPTDVMLGLNKTFVPSLTGNIVFAFTAAAGNTSDGSGAVTIMTGTGTPPSNGASSTGTARSTRLYWYVGSGGNGQVPVTAIGAVSGLTVGSTYWVDIAFQNAGVGGTLALTGATLVIAEI
jgi:hypothetical protein